MSRSQSLLARIDRSELVSLLYGEITTPEQAITLSRVADEAGVDAGLLRSATGTVDQPDTGTTNPNAVYDADVAIYAEDRDGLVTDHTPENSNVDQPDTDSSGAVPAGHREWEALTASLHSDIAAALRLSARGVDRFMARWAKTAVALDDELCLRLIAVDASR